MFFQEKGGTLVQRKEQRSKGFRILPWAILGVIAAAVGVTAALHWEEVQFLWKLHESYTLVEDCYLEETSADALGDAAIDGMVQSLEDPYAAYFDEESYQDRLEQQQGNMVGIGVAVYRSEDNGRLLISEVYEDSPAEEAGLQSGDWVIAADGTSFDALTADESLALVSGESGTNVTLTILRGEETFEKTLTRADVVVPSVRLEMIGDTAYLRITTFNERTAEEFSASLQEAQENGAEALIFDLRSNTGGLLNAAFDMLDELLPEGTLATKVTKDQTETVMAVSDAACVDLPMVVLTDAYTASASELFAAALRDYDKALLVGSKTYGKGVMQTTYTLSDDTGIKFTTAYFNPPSGENFNGKGLTPDISVEWTPTAETLGDPEKDLVLQRALEELAASEE